MKFIGSIRKVKLIVILVVFLEIDAILERACFKCGKVGHFMNACPSNGKANLH